MSFPKFVSAFLIRVLHESINKQENRVEKLEGIVAARLSHCYAYIILWYSYHKTSRPLVLSRVEGPDNMYEAPFRILRTKGDWHDRHQSHILGNPTLLK